MSYTSEDGKTVPLRLMDRIRPRVTDLAVALGFPRHVIDIMETKRDQVLYILGEWLEGRNQENDQRPLSWGTMIIALQHAGLIEEARILEKHFISTVSPVSERGGMLVPKIDSCAWYCVSSFCVLSTSYYNYFVIASSTSPSQ